MDAPIPSPSPIRLLHVTTVAMTFIFLRGQVGFLRRHGIEAELASAPPESTPRWDKEDGSPTTYEIPMERRITPLKDLLALFKLYRLIRRRRPHIVHSHTPKGGLLGMLGAWLARTPVRIYHLRGLAYVGLHNPTRLLLKTMERVTCALAHRVICIGPSLRDLALEEGLCRKDKAEVLARGGNGVDARRRFDPQSQPVGTRRRMRSHLGIPPEALVIGFVGRLSLFKGLYELASAWQRLREEHPGAHLLIVGPEEERDGIPEEVLEALSGDDRAHFVGSTLDVAPFYRAMDILALPTYREGFPNVPMEAAAMGLPVVATRVTGCIDAVLDGETGLLVEAMDAPALAQALGTYLSDEELRRRHGSAGRRRALRDFRREDVRAALLEVYRRCLQQRGYPLPNLTPAAQAEPETAL